MVLLTGSSLVAKAPALEAGDQRFESSLPDLKYFLISITFIIYNYFDIDTFINRY